MDKKWIYILGIILLSVILQFYIRNSWFSQKWFEINNKPYELVDTNAGFNIMLPSKPIVEIDSANYGDNIYVIMKQFKSKAPKGNKVVLTYFSLDCDTCSIEYTNNLVLVTLSDMLKSKGIDVNSGTEYKIGNYNGLVFKTQKKHTKVEYFSCVINNKAFIFGQSLDKNNNFDNKYLKTFEIK